jgi:thiol-disulfide isomerase/thioredoxin
MTEKNPRRLGNQKAPTPRSASAARRYQRSHRQKSSRKGWLAVGIVVVVAAALVVVKFVAFSGTSANSATSGRNPSPASALVVSVMSRISVVTYNSVGTGGQADPFVETANQPILTENGLPRMVYVGAEDCPYCALERWALVAALARFGTFTGLKQTSSSADVAPIPTFSFLGSDYKSKYIVFSPYETYDRNFKPLQAIPKNVARLYKTYDGTSSTPAKFNLGSSSGFPFLDIANQHVLSGVPLFLAPSTTEPPMSALAGGGPGMFGIAKSIADPTSVVGQAIDAKAFIIDANFITAEICRSDGNKPSSVCGTSGIKAAEKVIAVAKRLS